MIEASQATLSRIERVARELGASLEEGASRAVGAWIDQVAAWNQRVDLTAARNEDELVDLMLADALVLARHLPEGARVVDVGTGAGAPGLPLALVRRDLAVTLVEPMQKRVALLRTATGALAALGAFSNVPPVVRARGEEVAARGQRFDAAVSRATLAPAAWLELGSKLAPAGDVGVLLAQGEAPEGAIAVDERYLWPLTRAARRVVVFRSGASALDSAK